MEEEAVEVLTPPGMQEVSPKQFPLLSQEVVQDALLQHLLFKQGVV